MWINRLIYFALFQRLLNLDIFSSLIAVYCIALDCYFLFPPCIVLRFTVMACGALRPQQLLQLQLQQNHLMAIFVVRSISHLSVMIQSDTRSPGSGDLHSTFSSTIQNKLTQRRLSFDILPNIILFDKRKSSHHRLVNYFLFFPINFLICWLQCGSSNNGGS